MLAQVKTTIDLPDDLLRTVKLRAVQENRKLKDLVADLLQRGLAHSEGKPAVASRRVQLPLVECLHHARPDQEMTPDRVARVLLEEETRRWVG
jgi:plasmid stability protein